MCDNNFLEDLKVNDQSSLKVSPDADLSRKIVGVWQLVSYEVELQATGELINAMGNHPRGRVIFTNDGWVAFNLEGTDRKPAKTEADRARLMTSLVAYIGQYRIEGDQWITSVQTAWAPEWVGTEQRRNVNIEGNIAKVITPWREMPNWAKNQMSRSIITFTRA